MWVKGYAAYAAFCVLVILVRYRKEAREWPIALIAALTLPVVGLLLPQFWPRSWHKRNAERSGKDIDWSVAGITKGQVDADVYNFQSAQKEMNVIPLEEALLVNDLSTRRRVMIDLLKRDSQEYLDVLQMAVRNEDTETSHYAVSAIMEVKRKLTLALQELSVRYEADKTDPFILRSYADVLKGYMGSGFLDERTLYKHKFTYIEVLARLIENDANDVQDVFVDKINAELETERLDEAEKTALLFRQRYPRSEDAYVLLMKVYFSRRSFHQIESTLEQLKSSPVRLSNRALGMVRFWSEEA